jgi:hypothetical protein
VADGKSFVKFLAAPGYKKPQLKLAAHSPKRHQDASRPAVAKTAAKK